MRKVVNLNNDWQFYKGIGDITALGSDFEKVNVPHTWNAFDGSDGGNDYFRAKSSYKKTFTADLTANDAYLEFKAVNAKAEVYLNGELIATHVGGYSTFRVRVAGKLKEENELIVVADNSVCEDVYPQTADFTFYGGIYRDVNIIYLSKEHFDLDFWGSQGVKITPTVNGNGQGEVTVNAYTKSEKTVKISIYDGAQLVCEGNNNEKFVIDNVKLWNGVKDPHLYSAVCRIYDNGEVADQVEVNFGFRTYYIDPKKGFFLNGKPYPLHGVSRHQDRRNMGNAITNAEHEEDIRLILETGANTVRLAHYQHNDYFYDLCDKYGLVVWAEIPYISRHMPEANDNTVSQMTELIYQQYNHASIVCWGVSNEITMKKCDKKDMIAQHKKLNDLCHQLDPTRLTTLACYAACLFWDKSAHITDVVGWNLYLGWYTPFMWLNNVWFGVFRLLYPKRCIGMSEYGAEGMPNLHSVKPRRGDNTEEYQIKYHEYMLKFFSKRPYLWATHVWNMFDFAADARDQGGEPGMNHKGLVTYDRKTKKDAFYLYKAWWSDEPFVYITGKRFEKRTGNKLKVKVYSNQSEVELFNNGVSCGKKTGEHVFEFTIPMQEENKLEVVSGALKDNCVIAHVKSPAPEYNLKKINTKNWQK